MKRMLAFLLSFALLLTLSGSSFTASIEKKSSEQVMDLLQKRISKMTIDEKIGQLVMVGVDGETINDHLKYLINNYKVGGFIFFSKNIKTTKQGLTLINSIKKANSKNSNPLFLGVDEEGGRVTRMPSEFVKLPTNKTIGKINNETFSNKIGEILGLELKAFGFNIDFAPVLDINSNPKNPIIGDRAFGASADLVTKLGLQTMKGIQQQKVIPVIKHFPGHGDTSVDSHLGLPVVNNDLDRLNSRELIPFSKAINSGADIVMVGHILLPKLDAMNPASISKIIITDLLRNNLDFNGVVITDDMTMGAIEKNYKLEASSVKALQAGVDIILVCHEYEKQLAALKAIKKAVLNGTLSEQSINEKVYRILKLKDKYKISDTQISSVKVSDINNKITKLLNTYIK